MIIVALSAILQIGLGDLLIQNFSPLLSFILLVPFYMIVFLYFRKYPIILWIAVISIFGLLSSVYLWHYLQDYALASAKIRLVGRFSYILGIAENIAVFILVLQSRPKSNLLKGLFVFVALTHYALLSYYRIPISNILAGIFGPNPVDLQTMYFVIAIVAIIAKGVIMLVQVWIIYLLDRDEKRNIVI
ncbi:MAG: hypothetical protein JXB08_04320 [Bacilli bacterium]|nr:hypothetical protein [Bacilli bacterium]MBN2876381.1 hypothetical protein [Bacilli bacterium]